MWTSVPRSVRRKGQTLPPPQQPSTTQPPQPRLCTLSAMITADPTVLSEQIPRNGIPPKRKNLNPSYPQVMNKLALTFARGCIFL